MGRPIKAHHTWRPVNRSNRPVNRSNRETTFKPSDFLVKTPVTGQTGPVKPVGTGYTCAFEFGFEFNWFLTVSSQTGPVNRYWRAVV